LVLALALADFQNWVSVVTEPSFADTLSISSQLTVVFILNYKGVALRSSLFSSEDSRRGIVYLAMTCTGHFSV
jgi:hypothetical protein